MKKLIAICGIAILLSGCAGMKSEPTAKCVFQDKPATITTDFEGTTVGFCCEKCQTKWDSMSIEDKKNALTGMMK